MSSYTEENVVKNRLLFDGDGNGDDRRLNMLLKLTTKWAHATNPHGDPEEDIKVSSMMPDIEIKESSKITTVILLPFYIILPSK